jgi:hypothetical protein
MPKLPAIRVIIAVLAFAAIPIATPAAQAANPLKVSVVFLAAQRCHINGTVDYGCFQQRFPVFEKFVLQDDSSWLQKSIVSEGLVKTYDALKIDTPAATHVRAKEAIYLKALQTLDKSELGQIDDCRDEPSPDYCLRNRYCFKEAFIKIKNVLVTNQPELFQPEIKAFDREIAGNC